jgi:hypothetical protein
MAKLPVTQIITGNFAILLVASGIRKFNFLFNKTVDPTVSA